MFYYYVKQNNVFENTHKFVTEHYPSTYYFQCQISFVPNVCSFRNSSKLKNNNNKL